MCHGGGAEKAPSRSLGSCWTGRPRSRAHRHATAAVGRARHPRLADGRGEGDGGGARAEKRRQDDEAGIAAALAAARRVKPLPTDRERRLAMSLRASELVGLRRRRRSRIPRPPCPRTFAARCPTGRAAALAADEARAAASTRSPSVVAIDSAAAPTCSVAPLPRNLVLVARRLRAVPLKSRCRTSTDPGAGPTAAPLTFGATGPTAASGVHEESGERLASGESRPRARTSSASSGRSGPERDRRPDGEAAYQRRSATLHDKLWRGSSSRSARLSTRSWTTPRLDDADGTPPLRITGQIDRIDRFPAGATRSSTTRPGTPVHNYVPLNLQLTIYALACRDVLDLGTPERVTLYYTEQGTRMSTTRTNEQLDAARDELLARIRPIRAGEFTATPGRACTWCDYRAMCPERA